MTGRRIERSLETLFGPLAVVSVQRGTPWDLDGGFAQESVSVERAVPTRRAEFSLGRHLARVSLSALGAKPGPIPADHDRVPVWPTGYLGSITHCRGLTAAAVARSADLRAIGLDAEPASPLPSEIRELILFGEERAADPVEGTTVFSAKESIFKTIFPLVRAWIEFNEIIVRLDVRRGTFTASYSGGHERIRTLVGSLTGRAVRTHGFVVTGCHIPSGGDE